MGITAPLELHELIEKFKRNYNQYSSQEYKEAELRKEFIDPLFELLGWDMANKRGYAEQYKEVKYEPSLEVEGGTKAPDYAFRLGGKTIFFVEAKKPFVDINFDKLPAFQLKRYAWSQNIPLSILTNFEYIAVYDGRFKPNKNDDVSFARIMRSIPYEDLEKRWDAIANVFSRDAVLNGSFDQYAENTRGLRGTSIVNDAFLEEIEKWREMLAKNIALRNHKLTTEELNYSVQKIIDRIIFLRMCEDRGTEPQDQIRKIGEKGHIYRRLVDLFQLADAKYNSGLFHFSIDNRRITYPDELTPRLRIDDDILLKIIKNLYYPDSPYQFDVISVDILGQVYEQFLGKIIRLTEGHHAKVEEKPEVKKAGGVYYTPTYIVNYIVESTVGKLCKDKSPKEMEKLHILDPACGSGSFLIGAYERMLKEHLDWYMSNNPTKYKDAIFQGQKDEWRLTLQEKKRILLNNIYGVDIDGQAVEVTKLNLLLKALEGESKESVENVIKWFREPALPDLDKNIKNGNSLVDFDIKELLTSLQPEIQASELAMIKPFNWQNEFPKIFKDGGFDTVIGNPPYVRQETLGHIFKEYAKIKYSSYAGTADLYTYFIEKSHKLLRDAGLFGMICSNKFMRANYGNPLRAFISNKTKIIKIVDFGELPVFKNASTFPAIFLTQNIPQKEQHFIYAPIKRLDFQNLSDEVIAIGQEMDNRAISNENWLLTDKEKLGIIEKMKSVGIPLQKYIDDDIYFGIKTGLNEAFVIDKTIRDGLIKCDNTISEFIKPFIVGDDVRKYSINFNERYLILIPKGWTIQHAGTKQNAWIWFKDEYPALAKHLSQYVDLAEKRQDKGDFWWELRACDYYDKLERPKIVYPDIAKESRVAYDTEQKYLANTIYFIPTNDLYLLALLNSKLIFTYYKRTASVLGDADKGGRLRWFRQDVLKLPIRVIDFSNPVDKIHHEKIVTLVEQIFKLHKKLQTTKIPNEKTQIQREIDATDNEIDNIIYDIYGITAEEKSIIEKA